MANNQNNLAEQLKLLHALQYSDLDMPYLLEFPGLG